MTQSASHSVPPGTPPDGRDALVSVIHASVELVEAMRGVAPPANDIESRAKLLPDLIDACTQARAAAGRNPVPACSGWPGTREGMASHRLVSCPSCLRIMREAVDPVRWDCLEERGLVSLPATSEKPRTP